MTERVSPRIGFGENVIRKFPTALFASIARRFIFPVCTEKLQVFGKIIELISHKVTLNNDQLVKITSVFIRRSPLSFFTTRTSEDIRFDLFEFDNRKACIERQHGNPISSK